MWRTHLCLIRFLGPRMMHGWFEVIWDTILYMRHICNCSYRCQGFLRCKLFPLDLLRHWKLIYNLILVKSDGFEEVKLINGNAVNISELVFFFCYCGDLCDMVQMLEICPFPSFINLTTLWSTLFQKEFWTIEILFHCSPLSVNNFVVVS